MYEDAPAARERPGADDHLQEGARMAERICSVVEQEEACRAAVYGHGMCMKHYTRWRRNGDPLVSKRPMYRQPEDVKFFSKVDASGDCWEWLAAHDGDGYSKFEGDVAHRWIWRHLVGPIPDDHELDHLCRNRGCVNPDHLEPVPKPVNRARSFSPAAMNSRVTHCPSGHPYSGDNLVLVARANGRVGRQCRACRRAGYRKIKPAMRPAEWPQ